MMMNCSAVKPARADKPGLLRRINRFFEEMLEARDETPGALSADMREALDEIHYGFCPDLHRFHDYSDYTAHTTALGRVTAGLFQDGI